MSEKTICEWHATERDPGYRVWHLANGWRFIPNKYCEHPYECDKCLELEEAVLNDED